VLVRAAALVPPLLQNFALRKLLLEDSIGLLQASPRLGTPIIQHSVRRQQRKDFARITADPVSGFPPISRGAWRIPRAKPIGDPDRCPSNLLANGHHADALRCRHHIARVQNGFRSGVFNVDFSLNHGHARTLWCRSSRKRRPRDSYRAIRGANVQVPGSTLRGLHDDASLVEMDRRIATVALTANSAR